MSIEVQKLVERFADGEKMQAMAAVEAMKAVGVEEVIDAAMLSAGNIEQISKGDVALRQVLQRLVEEAKPYKDGWAQATLMDWERAATKPSPSEQHQHKPPVKVKKSVGVLKASFRSFTYRVAFGQKPKMAPNPSRVKTARGASVQDNLKELMKRALERVHKVFEEYAPDSLRMQEIRDGPDVMRSMQLEVYRSGSRSAKVVDQRARSSRTFFLDVAAYKWEPKKLTPFQVATWVHGRVTGGNKTGGTQAAATLKIVQAATEWKMHIAHPLVLGQTRSSMSDASKEPAAAALTPKVEVVRKIENLIDLGETAQIRCLAGFFCLLAYGTGRCTDAQQSRNVRLAGEAILGESLMKNKKVWTKWVCARMGLGGDWASKWMKLLADEGLPSGDFILWAPNSSYDGWTHRPAEYHDLRRALHFVLHCHCGMELRTAVEYNPHCFRHFMVESGQQLRSLKLCSEGDIEKLGHWKKGSSMPDSYDNASGVSELQARHCVMNALRSGWVPAEEGELPTMPPSKDTTVFVADKKRKRIHIQKNGSRSSRCGMWTCGTLDDPSPDARFADIPAEWKKCTPCCRNIGKPH